MGKGHRRNGNNAMSVTEVEVIKALYNKYRNLPGQKFFDHVKTGESWRFKGSEPLGILDGLGVKVSWTQPVFHGYEIKVSRSDFRRDTKHRGYLKFCTGLSFVVPKGMVKKDEIESDIGLIYYSDGKLHTVKKAARSEPEEADLCKMLRYLVYYRTGTRREQIAAACRRAVQARRFELEAQESYKTQLESNNRLWMENMELKEKLRKLGVDA